MPTFDVELRTINAFDIDDRYLFKAFFDENDLCTQLEQYYNPDRYRYEIPSGKIEHIEQILDEYFYELTYPDSRTPFIIAADKNIDTTNILRNAIHNQRRKLYHIFLMKNETSASQAIEQGAKYLVDTPINLNEINWKIDGS